MDFASPTIPFARLRSFDHGGIRVIFSDLTPRGCNLDLPSWKIVSAGTAALAYHPPEGIEIRDQKNACEGKQTIDIDGGRLTHFTDSAYLLFTMATLPESRLARLIGKSRKGLASIGTDRMIAGRGTELREKVLWQGILVPAH